jgi:L-seryl-tRNA(Ser) seleniumtransferase
MAECRGILTHTAMADFRVIPSIEQLRQRPFVRTLEGEYGHEALVEALREAAAALRVTLTQGGAAPADEHAAADAIAHDAASRLARGFSPSLQRVINATGVVVHTNLGRAPLAAAALKRIAELASGYSNLEYDVRAGTRGSRAVHAEALLVRLTSAEAAAVVNNNAGATLLLLAALAAGREVLISRGELVEIGGGFRVPDVMAQSGAILREVGTTNRTRVGVSAAAIGDRTALILRVHPSNFRIEGFTERPSLDALVELGRRFRVPVVEDLGSGALLPVVRGEPLANDSLRAGADVVCFSGDKLLGGPQAGILLGRRDLIDRIRRHPLMRALRADKLTYAALESTLIEYLAGRAATTVPVVRMLTMSVDEIDGRARALADALRRSGWNAEVIDGASAVGGGSAPGVDLPTRLVALSRAGESAERLDERLRGARPPIVARIERGRVVLDLRTVAPEDDPLLARFGGSEAP